MVYMTDLDRNEETVEDKRTFARDWILHSKISYGICVKFPINTLRGKKKEG